MSDFIPVEWDKINIYNSGFSPSTVHCRNTALAGYFAEKLFSKIISCYEIKIPDTWDADYFSTVLFSRGFIGVFKHSRYGIIPQNCQPYGYNIYYQPSRAIITNPLFNKSYDLKIGEDMAIIKLKRNWRGILPLVLLYADMMALCVEAAGVNLLNSKMAYIFATSSKAGAESFKKTYDQIQAGNPAAFLDKKLFDENGAPAWQLFTQDIGRNYVTDKILLDLKRIEAQFDEAAGIPNANTEKRERLVVDEVNANNFSTELMPSEVVKHVTKGFADVKNLFGVECSITYKGGFENGDTIN